MTRVMSRNQPKKNAWTTLTSLPSNDTRHTGEQTKWVMS
jgi:hypothetical protein